MRVYRHFYTLCVCVCTTISFNYLVNMCDGDLAQQPF